MCGTEEWEKKENMYGFYEKTRCILHKNMKYKL